MTEVTGRTAFITGGANGIGLGIARAFAAAGAKLALADVDADALAAAKAELSATTQVETVVLDVRDRDAFTRAADAVEDRLGPVSLLFNNAGVAGGAPVSKLNYDLWDWSLGVNLGGVVNGIQTFLPRMIARGEGGHVVNTASGAGLVGTGSGVLYCTGKFAIVGMSEALSAELTPANIGVSVLCPGPVATDIVLRSAASKPDAGDLSEDQKQAIDERNKLMTAVLHGGVSINDAGAMVLEAVQQGRLFIHTDRMMLPYIQARHDLIVAAMPAA